MKTTTIQRRQTIRRMTAAERVRAWRRARQLQRWQTLIPSVLRPRFRISGSR